MELELELGLLLFAIVLEHYVLPSEIKHCRGRQLLIKDVVLKAQISIPNEDTSVWIIEWNKAIRCLKNNRRYGWMAEWTEDGGDLEQCDVNWRYLIIIVACIAAICSIP